MPTEPIATQGLIVARPSRDYRWRRFALVAFLFLYGLYSAYDGFYRYPKENNAFHKANPLAEDLPHPALDIPFNQAFGIGLPPLALLFLAWVFYASRGSYRLDGQTLSVPGHQNIPVESIRTIDKAKWDRKGIAYLHYEKPGCAKRGVIKLDDFIYQRPQTDAIFAFLQRAAAGIETSEPIDSLDMQQQIVCTHCGMQNSQTAATCAGCGGRLDATDAVIG